MKTTADFPVGARVCAKIRTESGTKTVMGVVVKPRQFKGSLLTIMDDTGDEWVSWPDHCRRCNER